MLGRCAGCAGNSSRSSTVICEKNSDNAVAAVSPPIPAPITIAVSPISSLILFRICSFREFPITQNSPAVVGLDIIGVEKPKVALLSPMRFDRPPYSPFRAELRLMPFLAWRRISAAERRGSIAGAGKCSLAALVSTLAFPLTHCNPDGKPTEREPKAQNRMFRRIDERNGGEPHGHPDCDGHPTSPVHRPPTAQNRPRSEPVPRPIVRGTS